MNSKGVRQVKNDERLASVKIIGDTTRMSDSSPTSTEKEALAEWMSSQEDLSAEEDLPLSIIIPAYNEKRRLPPTLVDLIDFLDARGEPYEVIVVDDGSTDGTFKVIEKFERIRSQVRGIRLPKNYGKGHAVRTGALNAHGRYVLFADSDGSTPIEELNRLMSAIENGADIAIGSRAMKSQETSVQTRFYRKAIGRTFNFFVNLVLLPGVADTQCGFKLFSKEAAHFVFSRQQSDGFSFDLELLLLARKAGFQVQEVPVNWTNVPGSKVNLITDSARMFIDIFRFAWIHRRISEKDRVSAKDRAS